VGVSLKTFETMKDRVTGRHRAAVPALASDRRSPARHTVILGIDPSLRGTGYGVIRVGRPAPVALAQGVVTCPAGWARSRCLLRIAEAIRDVARQFQPTACAIEGLFYAQNLQTALIMGEARGASLVAAAGAGLEIFEIAPRKVKQAIVGYGAAQKLAVARMVQRLLQLPEAPAPDAADALALALAFAQEHGRYSLAPLKQI
jgi:crossover junction endodeoxyribonuclease RuvC